MAVPLMQTLLSAGYCSYSFVPNTSLKPHSGPARKGYFQHHPIFRCGSWGLQRYLRSHSQWMGWSVLEPRSYLQRSDSWPLCCSLFFTRTQCKLDLLFIHTNIFCLFKSHGNAQMLDHSGALLKCRSWHNRLEWRIKISQEKLIQLVSL